jgi:hypothetical protein
VTADFNGWQDSKEEEREAEIPDDLGRYDTYEGWPEESSGPEYWLHKRDAERGEV